MQTVENYNISNLLTIQIRTEKRRSFEGFNWPLEFFRTSDELVNPDITLNINHFAPDATNCHIVSDDCQAKTDYMYIANNDGESRWRAEISGLENLPININFSGKMKGLRQILAPDAIAQDQILFPLIEIVLGMKGSPLLHGGGFCIENGGIAIIGGSGSRKTTMIMKAARKGMKIVGDERILLTNDGLMCPFPIWPRILEYTIDRMQKEDMNALDRIMLLFHLNGLRNPSEIWSNGATKISRIFILGKRRGIDSAVFSRLSADKGAKKIIMDKKADLSDSHLMRGKRKIVMGLDAYCLINPSSKIINYWESLEKNLRAIIDSIPIFQIDVPSASSIEETDRTFDRLNTME